MWAGANPAKFKLNHESFTLDLRSYMEAKNERARAECVQRASFWVAFNERLFGSLPVPTNACATARALHASDAPAMRLRCWDRARIPARVRASANTGPRCVDDDAVRGGERFSASRRRRSRGRARVSHASAAGGAGSCAARALPLARVILPPSQGPGADQLKFSTFFFWRLYACVQVEV